MLPHGDGWGSACFTTDEDGDEGNEGGDGTGTGEPAVEDGIVGVFNEIGAEIFTTRTRKLCEVEAKFISGLNK